MNNSKGMSFFEMSVSDRFIVAGQICAVAGTALLSLGQIFKLFKDGQLPTTPINTKENVSNDRPVSLYGGRRSYFES